MNHDLHFWKTNPGPSSRKRSRLDRLGHGIPMCFQTTGELRTNQRFEYSK